MAQRKRDASFRALIDRFAHDLSGAIVELVQQQVKEAVARASAGRLEHDGRRAGRLCPVPGCGEPGAGPRNRWFCRDHAHSVPVREQKRILAERAKENQAAARLARARQLGGRHLDMRCRVEGCKNMSRGPRFGYICDKHRKELSAKEQREAREKWNAAHAKAA